MSFFDLPTANLVYPAKTLFKGHPEYHPRLIEYDLWKKVQDVIEGRASFKKRWAFNQEFTYVHLIRCGGNILDEEGRPTEKKCGCAVSPEVKRKLTKKHGYRYRYYYSCANNRSKTGCTQRTTSYLRPLGIQRYIPQEKITEILAGLFTRFDYSNAQIKKMIDSYQKYEEGLLGDANVQLEKLRAQKAEVSRLISKSY